jgi:hypothetical protein
MPLVEPLYCQAGRFVTLADEPAPCPEFGIETWMIGDSWQPGRRLLFGMCRTHDVDLWVQVRRMAETRYYFARLIEVER